MRKKNTKQISDMALAYREYLNSEAWAAFKVAKEAEQPKVCLACNGDVRIQLHHMIYRADVSETLLADTIWLCWHCHMLYHSAKPDAMKRKTKPDVMIAKTLRVIELHRLRLAHRNRNT